jgi:hypothetical protein
MKKMDFNQVISCDQAILEIFFLDQPIFKTNENFLRLVKNVIEQEFRNVVFQDLDNRPEPHRAIARTALELIRKIRLSSPNVNAKFSLHYLLWIRWALNVAEVSPSTVFFKQLLEWRLRLPTNQLFLLQYKSPHGEEKWRGPSYLSSEFGKVRGYSVDDVIFGKQIREKEYSLIWRVKKFQQKGEMKVEVNPTQLGISKKKPTSRTTEQICGTKLLDILNFCISKTAKSGRKTFLSKRRKMMEDGRSLFGCSISRDELVIRLKNKFPQVAKYGDETIKRALPSIVKCPRGKSKAS